MKKILIKCERCIIVKEKRLGRMLKKIVKGFMAIALVFSSLYVASGCNKDDDQSLTKEELSELYEEVALETWESLGVDNPITSMALLANVVDKKTETTSEGAIDNIKINANSMAGLIYMVSLLYANENFETTNNIAKFDADITMGGQSFSQSYILETSLDKKNNKVYLEALVTVMGSVQYSNIEVDYDFSTNTLKAYRFFTNVDVIGQYVDMGLTTDGKYMWYDTNSETDEFAVAVEAEKSALTAAANEVTKLTTNFGGEIQVYMDVIQNIMENINNR